MEKKENVKTETKGRSLRLAPSLTDDQPQPKRARTSTGSNASKGKADDIAPPDLKDF